MLFGENIRQFSGPDYFNNKIKTTFLQVRIKKGDYSCSSSRRYKLDLLLRHLPFVLETSFFGDVLAKTHSSTSHVSEVYQILEQYNEPIHLVCTKLDILWYLLFYSLTMSKPG